MGDLRGDADQRQELLLVWVELVVLEAGPADPAAEDGAGGGHQRGGVEGAARFDVVEGAVIVALPGQVPRRVPPGVDRGDFAQVG
ncbi:hypothetical protein ABZ752_09880 [Streptomyces roseifaciens]